MSEEKTEEIIALLQEIKALQAAANEQRVKQLEISQVLFARSDAQFEKASHLQAKAEAMQVRASKILRWLIPFLFLFIALILVEGFYRR